MTHSSKRLEKEFTELNKRIAELETRHEEQLYLNIGQQDKITELQTELAEWESGALRLGWRKERELAKQHADD